MTYEPSQCPIRFGLGVFGDRWSLLIIRDMMFRGYTRFREFLDSGEGISTNILADRLSRLEAQQVITRRTDPANRRSVVYELTPKGNDLLPVMVGIFAWAGKHDRQSRVTGELAARLEANRLATNEEMDQIARIITERLSNP